MLFAARKRVSAGLYVGGRSFVYLALEESGGEVRVAASSSGTFQSQLGNGGSPFSVGKNLSISGRSNGSSFSSSI